MSTPFDGAEVKPVHFRDVGIFGRFFDENGEGYTKHSDTECYNDYSFNKIRCHPDTKVWVKK